MTTREPYDDLFSRVHGLATAMLYGDGTDEEARELERLVLDNPEARDNYIDCIEDYQALRTWAKDEAPENPMADVESMTASKGASEAVPGSLGHAELLTQITALKVVSKRSAYWQSIKRFANNHITLSMLLSSLFMAIFLLSLALIVPDWKPYVPPAKTPSIEFVAHITATHEATFDKTSQGNFHNTDLFEDDLLVVLGGLVEVTYNSGARVVLEAPTTYQIQGRNGGKLLLGKLTARVEQVEAKGFVIDTPQGTIVDLGTAFGAAVDAENGTQVEVSVGEVELTTRQGERRQLRAGQSLQITSSGQFEVKSGGKKSAPTFAWSLPVDPLPRPLLHWTFDEVRPDGTTPDHSPNDLDGRLEASMGQANLVEGPPGFGRALQFDGKRQCVSLVRPRERALNHTFRELTIAAWIHPEAESPGYFLGKMGGAGDRGWQWMVGDQSLSLIFFTDRSGAEQGLIQSPLEPTPPGKFTHVAVTFAADQFVRLYVNGRLVREAAAPSGINWDNTANFCVGHRGDSLPKAYFAGAIDDVRVYGTALSAIQIQKLVNDDPPAK